MLSVRFQNGHLRLVQGWRWGGLHAGDKRKEDLKGEDEELEVQGEVQEAGKRVAEARDKAKWETHFAKQDMAQQSDNGEDFGYERAAVGHDKPAL